MIPHILSSLLYAAALQGPTTIEVHDTVVQAGVKRFGVNLGHSTPWEASQLISNLIPNPGFEAGYFAMVTHAAVGTSGDVWVQDHWRPSWNNEMYDIGQPEDFWNGAEFEIVTGPSKGRIGLVLDYTHANDRGTLVLDSNGPLPAVGDIMFLRMPLAAQPDDGDLAEIDTTDARPGSPGVQCLRLSVDPNQLWRASRTWYMDSYWNDRDRSAGKLQLADGLWHFSMWAKGTQAGDSIRIKFARSVEATFIEEIFPLSTQWQLLERTYSVPVGSDDPRSYSEQELHPILSFGLYPGDAGQEVLIDDLILERVHANPHGFTDQVVSTLQELRPGVLRSGAGFFGNDLEQALAEPFAGGFSGYSPAQRIPGLWNYRLHDFLGLCDLVGAEPWFVFPVTWSEADLQGLVEYLAGPADGAHPWADLRAARGHALAWTEVFDTIHLEFSNEGWGAGTTADPFFGASLIGGTNLGMVANDRLTMLKASPEFRAQDFDLIIGGQHAFPGRQDQIESASSQHDALGIGPYFMRILDDFATDDAIYQRLFAVPVAETAANGGIRQSLDILTNAGQGTKLHIYEINFHLNQQDALNPAPASLRNDVLSGQGGALVLPLSMLTYLRDLGIELQLAFAFTGFSSAADDGAYLRMWGLVRDLLNTGHKRPTFLGLALTNLAMIGDMTETVQTGSDPIVSVTPGNGLASAVDLHLVQSFAFHRGARRTLILFNLDLSGTQEVIIDTSGPVLGRVLGGGLAPLDIHADNEDEVQVEQEFRVLPNFQDGSSLTLPPASMVVLTWRQ